MIVPRFDDVIGRSLALYGEWAEHELRCLRPYVVPGSTVVDVGAYIGTHTLAMSSWVGAGRVLAVEAQPAMSSVLVVNSLLNGRPNVHVVNAICGRRAGRGVSDIDYWTERNFGAMTFKPDEKRWFARVRDWYHRSRSVGDAASVAQVRLDDYIDDHVISLIKLDIEGMEFEALMGATKMLRRWRPVLYLEQLNTVALRDISAFLRSLDYRLFWLETHPFNQNNYKKEEHNIWWRTETGILAIRNEAEEPRGLVEVTGRETLIETHLDARVGIFLDDADRDNPLDA